MLRFARVRRARAGMAGFPSERQSASSTIERPSPASAGRGGASGGGRAVRRSRGLSALMLVVACQQSPGVRAGPEPGPAPAPEDPGQRAPAPPTQPPSSAPGLVPPLSPRARLEDERNSIEVFEAAAPATVFVINQRVVVDYWSRDIDRVPQGTGSGFLWDKLGHVVTNYHVARGAQSFEITLYDNRTFGARLIGAEPRKDIAVLKLDKPPADLRPLRVERGLELQVGQKTLAIGNPFGLDQTLTTGVVSALGRSMPGPENVTIRDMVQTDAAINPGNSGGPLLDSSGRLIGMNTMIYSKSGSSAGIGFAVPASAIARVVPQIIRNGKVEEVGIGVEVNADGRIERQNGIVGVMIRRVRPGGPAAKAGLKGLQRTRGGWVFGDIIVGVDDLRITNYDDLYNAMDRHRAGDRVILQVFRPATRERLSVKVQLQAL